MRAVVQRCSRGIVIANGQEAGKIETGLTVLLGIKRGDTEKEVLYMMEKIANLRIFEDRDGKMNLSAVDLNAQILLVSQFTLYGDARKGRRPGFSDAEISDPAEELINYSIDYLRSLGLKVETGVFGAQMQLIIENEGPCTILLDSEKNF